MASLNPACDKCPLSKSTKGTVCLAGEGPRDAEVMVVGEAPGAEEEKTGRPFMGKSGQKLRQELAKNDIRSVFITNTVRCRPPENRAPTAAEIKACREYLDYEIARVKPQIVVSLGATPTKALFKGVAAVSKHHGKLIPPEKQPFTGYVSYHPAAMLYNPSLEIDFQQDIARLGRILREEQKEEVFKWNVVRRGNLRQFLREFRKAKEFAFDLETSGLFAHDGKGWINSCQVGLPGKTWVIPRMKPGLYPTRKNPKKLKWHKGSPWGRGRSFEYLMRALIGIAKKTHKTVVTQNGKFDNIWLQRYVGKRFRIDFDTMLASHTLDENEDHDLKSMSRKYLDVPEYDLTTAEKRGNVDPFKLYQYGARDAGYTLRLRTVFDKKLKEERELDRLFYRLVMPAVRAMEDIELVGKTMNVEALDELGLDLRAQEIQLEADLNETVRKLCKIPEEQKINWSSPKQVAKILYEDLGIKCTVKTAKGAPSTSETAVIDLKGKHPVVDKLIKYREVTKFRSTYVVGFRDLIVDDKLFISYKVHGTVTGRYSSRIHSIPRDGSVRNLVIAPKGWKFVQADISQAELRIIAQISGDLEMRKCFLEGIDIHWRTLMFAIQAGYIGGEYAQRVLDTAEALNSCKKGSLSISDACEVLLAAGHEAAIKVWPGWKEGRKKAKAINFGYVYGMYEKKFIETAKTKYGWEPTWDEAHACREGYFHLYRELPKWHEKQKKLVNLNGFVRNMYGRKRRLPGIESSEKGLRMEAERQAINSPVQGTIGDWKAAVLVEIHETVDRDKLRICGEHHDALLMLVRDGCEDQVLPQVISIIRHPALNKVFRVQMDIPMDGEIEIGPWGAGKPYKLPSERKAA